jgi:protein involved in polysaccharide export with SLBB domain
MVTRVRRGTALLVAAAVLAQATAPLLAQSVDPSVLARLQGQLGSPSNSAASVDRSREAGDARNAVPTVPTARIDTREEQDLRRAEARDKLTRFYAPSPIEREFHQRLADPTLRQFGYELFANAVATTGPLTGSVGDDYVIGIGDDIVVQLQGATNDSQTARVGRDGRLIAGQLPPVPAAGRSIAAVKRDLQGAVRRTLLGTDVFVSLGSVRSVTVFVGGEVDRPGQYNMTALSDISAALAQAGGVRRSGSLRNVRIVRGGSSISVDLYGLLGIGSPPLVRLRDGDRVIVPVIGDTVAVSGAVARPGIYEIRPGVSLAAVLAFAGGALRPRGNAIAVSRIDAGGREAYLRAPALATTVLAGDGVTVTGGSAGGAIGRVSLRGYVANPGVRALGAAPTVHDLLGQVADLRPDTYLPMAVLIRRDPATAARVFEPVNLVKALNDRPGVGLRSDDRLYVFSRSDIEFLNRAPVRRVVLGQSNDLVACASLTRLELLVAEGQSAARFNAVTRGSFIVERNGRSELAVGNQSDKARDGDMSTRLNSEQGLPRIDAQRPTTVAADAETDDQRRSNAQVTNRLAYARGETYEARQRLRDAREDANCPIIFEEEPDLLPVLIENAVAVGGAVRRPGAYPVAGAVSAEDMAGVAEGLLPNASALVLDVNRANANAGLPLRVAATADPAILASTMVSAGDDIRFNAAQVQFEPGGVQMTGEVNRPGLYAIRRGETLSQLIARAGGLSNLAYPYGTIFTRRSVKELEQEGLRRTSRELTKALLAVSSRKGTTGDSVIAGQQLIAQLARVESPGRVVVEADPRVLERRPDLDTVLESGDAIVIPKKPSFVLALGDVSNPGALQFVNNKPLASYLRETGGLQSTADKRRIFIVLPDGTAAPVGQGGWGRTGGNVIPPGSTIIIPKNIDPLYSLDLVRDISTIVASLLTSVATVAILATR